MDALSTVQVPAPAGWMSDSEVIAAPVSCADRKVRWRSSFPLRGPLPFIWPRTAIPFDRHPAPGLFAPQVSDANSQLRQDPSRHTPYYAGRPTGPEIWALNPRG